MSGRTARGLRKVAENRIMEIGVTDLNAPPVPFKPIYRYIKKIYRKNRYTNKEVRETLNDSATR